MGLVLGAANFAQLDVGRATFLVGSGCSGASLHGSIRCTVVGDTHSGHDGKWVICTVMFIQETWLSENDPSTVP